MIARTWRGAVRREDADAYSAYMEGTGAAEYAASVRAFAGPDPAKVVFSDEDDRFLVERQESATHFETLAALGVAGAGSR